MQSLRKNVIYFQWILKIGGTEQYLFEMAKKYGANYDIEVMYEVADESQIKRLSKYVRCTKWTKGEIVECEKYFANFNLNQVPYVKAKEYYFTVHANFNEIGYKPDISILPPNAKFIGVSKFACREFKKFTGKDAELCYNPLTLEPKEKVVRLVSACRLNDIVKGGERTKKLIKALDDYCLKHNRHYEWKIFTNAIEPIESPNVILMKPRIDVRPYIADADIGLQLSNDMETYCYSLVEFAGYGLGIVTTPLSVLPEHNIPKEVHTILNWDCSNVDQVAKWIMETEIKPYKYIPPKDNWENYLVKGESQYSKELKMEYRVKVIRWDSSLIDTEVGRAREENEVFVVKKARLDILQDCNQLELEVIEKLEKAVKPATKKTTRKAK